MENLNFYYRIVEGAISQIGIDPETCRGENPGQWTLTRGTVKVYLDLWHIKKEGRAYFQVMSKIMPIPTDRREDFYRELLEINDKFFGVAFSIYKDYVWIKTIREVKGMDENETHAMIMRVRNYSDSYDNKLKAKYLPGDFIVDMNAGPGPSSDR